MRDANFRTFRLSEMTEDTNPVIFIHSPRESGITTLIGSLLVQMQQEWGLDGAFVLTDRADKHYMGGILPDGIVQDKPFEQVLRKMIEVQRHRQSTVPGSPLKLALAVDDYISNVKELKSITLQRDIKLAKKYNISIIIATPDASVFPPNCQTLATHVIATKCISTEEPKLLKKSMFVMYDSPASLAENLALCGKHEFLVGLLRLANVDGTSTMHDYSRTYTPTLFARDESFCEGEDYEEATFTMSPELISHMTYALGIRPELK